MVTGAGAGIGRGSARRLAREGARVLVAEWSAETRTRTAGELAALGGEGRFVRTDVGERAQIQAAVRAALDAWGQIDVLVNNAWSGTGMGRVEWKTTEEMERAFRVG